MHLLLLLDDAVLVADDSNINIENNNQQSPLGQNPKCPNQRDLQPGCEPIVTSYVCPVAVDWRVQVSDSVPIGKEQISGKNVHPSIIILEELHTQSLENQTVDENPKEEERHGSSHSVNAAEDQLDEHAKVVVYSQKVEQFEGCLRYNEGVEY